jgi:hypothetical protein
MEISFADLTSVESFSVEKAFFDSQAGNCFLLRLWRGPLFSNNIDVSVASRKDKKTSEPDIASVRKGGFFDLTKIMGRMQDCGCRTPLLADQILRETRTTSWAERRSRPLLRSYVCRAVIRPRSAVPVAVVPSP